VCVKQVGESVLTDNTLNGFSINHDRLNNDSIHLELPIYLVFRQRKAPDRKNKVLILDASKEFKTGRAQNELLPEHVTRIHGWYHAYQDVESVARVVTLEEVAANDYNLNIPRYVEPKVDQEVLTVEEAMQRLQASAAAAFAAEDKLIAILKREGLLQ
jgi:type I restriction enzyme M protein